MPAVTSLTLNDRESTPVGHIFAPRLVNPTSTRFAKAGTTPLSDIILGLNWSETDKFFNRRLMLYWPIVTNETVNGVVRPIKLRDSLIEVRAKFSRDSTLQERRNAIGVVGSALAHTFIDDVLTGLNPAY